MDNLRENTPHGVLDQAAETGAPLILGMCDGRQRKEVIKSVTDYDFELEDGIHAKRDVLYTIPPKSAKKLKKAVKKNQQIAALGHRPAERVKDRLWISKMVLQKLIDESLKARFTLTDGTVVPCRVRSFGLYEIDANIQGGGDITIFRHGVYRIEVGDQVLADHTDPNLGGVQPD